MLYADEWSVSFSPRLLHSCMNIEH